MRVAYFVNYINHHRISLADELYNILGDEFALIATMPRDEKELKGGIDYSFKPYCLLAAESKEAHMLALKYARESEVCSFGAGSMEYAIQRAKYGRSDGVVFETSERWLKKGWINCLSPNLIKWWIVYQILYKKRGFYKLCSSAYAAADHYKILTYRGRCYKWGYFTHVDDTFNPDVNIMSVAPLETIKIMWCGRFLNWKHPEMPILLAKELKLKGYRFRIDIFGGEIKSNNKFDLTITRQKLENLIIKLGVQDCVSLNASLNNDEILREMKKHRIFLFTSDRNEGWGVVANESMASGCAIVASDQIGSAPYLIRDGVNGFLYENGNLNSLVNKVEWLLTHPNELVQMQKKAFYDILNLWSPKVAAENLLRLVEDLKTGADTSISEGPGSKAIPI